MEEPPVEEAIRIQQIGFTYANAASYNKGESEQDELLNGTNMAVLVLRRTFCDEPHLLRLNLTFCDEHGRLIIDAVPGHVNGTALAEVV